MRTFITIFLKDKEVNKNLLSDFLKDIVGFNASIVEKNNLSFIFQDNDDLSFNEVIEAINYELLISAKLFKAPKFEDNEDLNAYLEMVDKIDLANYSKLYYQEADLIINRLGDKEILKKSVFKKYYNTRFEEEIKTFLDQNMNVSKSADILYLHRNTLMNKIDKFIEVSGYDIRKFKDAFVIYHLL